MQNGKSDRPISKETFSGKNLIAWEHQIWSMQNGVRKALSTLPFVTTSKADDEIRNSYDKTQQDHRNQSEDWTDLIHA